MNDFIPINPGGRLGDCYRQEMARTRRTIWQSVAVPVITTALYFVVFGGAIGSRIQQVGGVSYGAFIVPGLIMLSLLTQSISNASIGLYFLPKFTGTIFEIRFPLRCLRPRSCSPMSAQGGHQIGNDRPHHSGDRDPVRAGADLLHSVLDDRLPRADFDQPSACSASSSASGRRISSRLAIIPSPDRGRR